MDMNPTGAKGFMTWAITGFIGAIMALLVAKFIPSIIPSNATKTTL